MKWEAAVKGILLYSDTDSLITSEPLPDYLLGNKLGELKLENIAEKGIFLSPKVYGLKDVKINDITVSDVFKAKGLKNEEHMSFTDYERLLNKDEVFRTSQQKWFRNISEGTIRIAELSTMVRINEGKRVVVTDLKDQFIDTWNIIFEDGQVVSPYVVK